MKKIKNVIGDNTILLLKRSVRDEEDDKSFNFLVLTDGFDLFWVFFVDFTLFCVVTARFRCLWLILIG